MAESPYSDGAGAERGEVAPKRVTVPDIRARKGGAARLVAVTAYDVVMARLLDEAGVDILLVGDSLGMVFQGLPNTLRVTVDDICYHGRAVARAKPRAHLVGDMPFMSYQASVERAVDSAGKMLKLGDFESVKLEGGEEIAEQIRRITRVGIPVMGHVGLLPQRVHALGGFKVQGRTTESAAKVVSDARILEEAGVYAIVLEAIPPDVAAEITRAVSVPTIGIGAGPQCDGQVLVCTDLLGLSVGPGPRFTKRYAELGNQVVEAARKFASEVRAGTFPTASHSYAPADAAAPGTQRPPAVVTKIR